MGNITKKEAHDLAMKVMSDTERNLQRERAEEAARLLGDTNELDRLRAENARLLARCERYEGSLRKIADGTWRTIEMAEAVALAALAGEEGKK